MAKQVCIEAVSVMKQCPPDQDELGPELVTNGDFEAPNGGEWVFTGSASMDWPATPNKLTFTKADGTAEQALIFETGKTYEVSVYIAPSLFFSAGATIYNGSNKDEVIVQIPSDFVTGTYTFVFTATSATSDGSFFVDKLADGGDFPNTYYLNLDDISVKEYVNQGTVPVNYCRGDISYWNPPDGIPMVYKWTSKEFQTANPLNFGAFRCYWEGGIAIPGVQALQAYIDFNTERIQYPLNPLNSVVLGGSHKLSQIQSTLSQNRAPLGGSALFNIELYEQVETWVNVKVYANEKLRYAYTLPDTEPHRLPAGYKAERWIVEFEGIANVGNFKMAETGKELKTV